MLPPFAPPFHVPETYRTAPDLHRLEGRHFLLDAQFETYVRQKIERLRVRVPRGGYRIDAQDAGLEEALWRTLEQVALEWPEFVALEEGAVHHRLLGLRLGRDGPLEATEPTALTAPVLEHLAGGSPLERLADFLALGVQEDLAVMRRGVAEWLHVCFPSHWDPAHKLGQGFADIHRPVAHSGALLRSSASLTRAMQEKGPFVRWVWLLETDEQLDQHPLRQEGRGRREALGTLEPSALAARSWLRFERQTTRALGFECSLFTIRVTVQPLTDLAADQEKRLRLARALRSMDEAALAYRRYAPFRDAWVAWLEGA